MATERQLSSVLSEFARTMLTDFPIQAILDHLVGRIVDVLPITAAGVTLISPDTDPHFVAASDQSALRFEELQSELAEGPCVTAYETGEAVSVPDLRADTRFPNFAPQAVKAGLSAVFTFPLRAGNARLGALDLYRDSAGPLDDDAMEAAQTLADVAAAYLINARARDELQESSDQSLDRALHDPLTGLPNRVLLLERIDQAILRARRSNSMASVLFVDLDGFKLVNDLHGHMVGDKLLRAVAQRLTEVLRPGDTLARMSGDEFVVLCEDLRRPEEAETIAMRMTDALTTPFLLDGVEIAVAASVGISFSGRGDELSEQLIHDADTAMYHAKRDGGGQHQIVDLRDQRLAVEEAELVQELRGAAQRDELRLEYQPIVSACDERILGMEALVRWAHPSLGVIMPARLIPMAEQSGVITELGRWVLEAACADQVRWRHSQMGELRLSVNVSMRELLSKDYAASVAAVLSRTTADPRFVTLEVTESVFAPDDDRALQVLNELKQLGMRIALDDFGTGYASLSRLGRFPVDVVKIDRAFIVDFERDPVAMKLVRAIVDLAHAMNMMVVAEGVETAEQQRQLTLLGCDAYQGYHFTRPMSTTELESRCQTGVLMPAAAS